MPMYFFDVLERGGTMTHDVIGVRLDGPHQLWTRHSEH